MKIHYFEDDCDQGTICFTSTERFELPDGKSADCRATGMVPKKIVAQGERAIKKHAKQYVKKQIALQKEVWENLDKHLKKLKKNINRPIKIKCNGANLEGRMTGVTDGLYIKLKMQKPIVVKDSFYLPQLIEHRAGFFESTDRLLKEMITMTYDRIIYRYEKRRVLKDMINKLNKDR